MTNSPDKTTISVKHTTRDMLLEFKHGNDSFDLVLRTLMQKAKQLEQIEQHAMSIGDVTRLLNQDVKNEQ